MRTFYKTQTVINLAYECFVVDIEMVVAGNGLPGISIVGINGRDTIKIIKLLRSLFNLLSLKFPARKIVINIKSNSIPPDVIFTFKRFYTFSIFYLLLCHTLDQIPQEKAFLIGDVDLAGNIYSGNGLVLMDAFVSNIGGILYTGPSDFLSNTSVRRFNTIFDFKDFLSNSIYKSYFPAAKDPHFMDANQFIENTHIPYFIKRAMLVSLSGRHSMLIAGSPGLGKTFTLEIFNSLQIPLSISEGKEKQLLESILGEQVGSLTRLTHLDRERQIRGHFSNSGLYLGNLARSHMGILLVDDMCLMNSFILKILKEVLDYKFYPINIPSLGDLLIKADSLLWATRNPCPCGFYGVPKKKCICSVRQIHNYNKGLSYPFLERISIHINFDVTEVSGSDVPISTLWTKAFEVREEEANLLSRCTNDLEFLSLHCKLNTQGERYLNDLENKYTLSLRSRIKILRLAFTISRLLSHPSIAEEDLKEAFLYRRTLHTLQY